MTIPVGDEPSVRPPWSRRRRRLLAGLGIAAAVLAIGALVLPAQYGVGSGMLAALCALLVVAATAVFVAVPGPGTLGTLLRSSSLAGAVLVVSVLLLLSTRGSPLQWLWWVVGAAAVVWGLVALWHTRRSGT